MIKKIIQYTLAFIFLCINSAFAIPAEGNFLPSVHRWVWGVQYNNILRRDFNKVESKTSSIQYFIKGSFGLTQKLFFDGKIGWGNIQLKCEDGINNDFPTNFSGGYGLRYLCYENEDFGLKSIFGFQHISCHPHKDVIDNIKYYAIWDEWQGTGLLIKCWDKAAIYFGPQYSVAQLKYKEDDQRCRLKSEDTWGVLIGGDYQVRKNININIESRFFDEWALNLGINVKF